MKTGLRQVNAILFKEKRDILLSIICGFIAGITAVGLFSSSGYLISKAALTPPIYTLMVLVAVVKLLGIISALSRYGERYYSHRGTFTMLSNLRASFYNKIEPHAPGVFQRYRSGDLLARIVGDVETLQNYFLRVFYPPVVLALVFLATIFFTSFFSLQVSVILFIGLILTTIAIPFAVGLKQQKIDQRVRESRGALSSDVTELLYGQRDLKIYQQMDKKERELLSSTEHYMEEQKKESIHKLYSESANTFVSLAVSVAVLAAGAYLVSEGQLEGIFLAMLVMVSLTVFENTSSMAAFPSHLQDSRQAIARLDAVVEAEVAEQAGKQFSDDAGVWTGPPEIRFEHVTFIYPGEERPALADVSFALPAGSKTAIVGPSGSGKSTVMQLLLKMQKNFEGEIGISGTSLSSYPEEMIWENSNAVLQANHFFYGTIRSNLEIANGEAGDSALEKVLEKVELQHLKLGDQVLERGENLSGGEKQRLAIARALLKQSRLWLLDEPTSSIDAITESRMYGHLFEAAKNDTLVLISHRLTGLETMDQIIVMENGTVKEMGTFSQLMEKKGYLYEMKKVEKDIFTAL